MGRTKKKFSELPLLAKVGIITTATAQITLFLTAQVDLLKRSSEPVRGRKKGLAILPRQTQGIGFRQLPLVPAADFVCQRLMSKLFEEPKDVTSSSWSRWPAA